MTAIPTLTTQRLTLRAPHMGDWPEYRDFMMSDRPRYMGGPYTLDGAWGMFCTDLAQWQLFGVGGLMLEERATGRCMGQVGINAGPLFPEYELGWLVYDHAEGRGYAHEGAVALRRWGFETRGLSTLVSYVDPPNQRSRALAERLGAVPDPDAPRQDPTDLVYRHPAP